MTALFEISPADVADTSDDYYTPPWIFDAAGLVFDMDVAAPIDPARRLCPARRYLTPVEDGLEQHWEGLVWMNPPYSRLQAWVDKFTGYPTGLALVPGYQTNLNVGSILRAADAVAFLSVKFMTPLGKEWRPPYPLILAGQGEIASEAVGRIAAADKYLKGAYHVRPRGDT